MANQPEKLNDKWLRLFGIPAVELLTNLLYLEQYNYNWWIYFRTSFWGTLYIWAVWDLLTRWLCWIRKQYPRIEQTRRRILATFAGYYAIVTACQLSIVYAFGALGLAGVPITRDVYIHQVLGGYLAISLVGAVYEIIYYMAKYRQAIEEAEALKKANLQSQFESLKQQVNPHFLFNSLNSLSSLIHENSDMAEEFVDELSKVYRYLLRSNEVQITTLARELEFAQSYFHLLETRHSGGIRLTVDVPEPYQQYLLPPLTLQILLENAVKHNVIMKETPLSIVITANEEGLVVRNNLQRKTIRVPSDKVGLANITTKYQLLKQAAPVIEDDGRFFTVRLPLAQPERSMVIER